MAWIKCEYAPTQSLGALVKFSSTATSVSVTTSWYTTTVDYALQGTLSWSGAGVKTYSHSVQVEIDGTAYVLATNGATQTNSSSTLGSSLRIGVLNSSGTTSYGLYIPKGTKIKASKTGMKLYQL